MWFLAFTLRQCGVDPLGLRRISSDLNLKDLLHPERIKKSFSSTQKNGKTAAASRISHDDSDIRVCVGFRKVPGIMF